MPNSDVISPRNAIGGISGMVQNQQSGYNQSYGNIMNRRKSNTMNSAHGPVDITAMMRAQQRDMDPSGQKGKNASSSRGRNPQNSSSTKDHHHGVHLPPMPLTPTE